MKNVREFPKKAKQKSTYFLSIKNIKSKSLKIINIQN